MACQTLYLDRHKSPTNPTAHPGQSHTSTWNLENFQAASSEQRNASQLLAVADRLDVSRLSSRDVCSSSCRGSEGFLMGLVAEAEVTSWDSSPVSDAFSPLESTRTVSRSKPFNNRALASSHACCTAPRTCCSACSIRPWRTLTC